MLCTVCAGREIKVRLTAQFSFDIEKPLSANSANKLNKLNSKMFSCLVKFSYSVCYSFSKAILIKNIKPPRFLISMLYKYIEHILNINKKANKLEISTNSIRKFIDMK